MIQYCMILWQYKNSKSLLCWEGWWWGTGVTGKHLLLFAYFLPQIPAGQSSQRQRDLSCKSSALLWKLINKMVLGSHALPLLRSSSPFLPKPPASSPVPCPTRLPLLQLCSAHTLQQLSSLLALCSKAGGALPPKARKRRRAQAPPWTPCSASVTHRCRAPVCGQGCQEWAWEAGERNCVCHRTERGVDSFQSLMSAIFGTLHI